MRRYEAQRIQPRWWRRLSCRYLCYAARNPPSDDSQRHKSLVSHLSGAFPSPSFRLPPSSSLSLCVSRTPPSTSRSSFLVSSRRFLSFLRFLPQSRVALSSQVLQGSRPYISPGPAVRFYRSTVMVVSAKSTGASVTSTRAELSQPASAYHHNDREALHRRWWFTMNRRTCARKIYGRFQSDIDRCNINKLKDLFTLA